jgi:hypothetical protein
MQRGRDPAHSDVTFSQLVAHSVASGRRPPGLIRGGCGRGFPFPWRRPIAREGPAVTLDEYLDPRRFPLTTRPGLTPRLQFLADAADLDRLYAQFAAGDTPTEELWLMWDELEEKAMARPALLAQLSDTTDGE